MALKSPSVLWGRGEEMEVRPVDLSVVCQEDVQTRLAAAIYRLLLLLLLPSRSNPVLSLRVAAAAAAVVVAAVVAGSVCRRWPGNNGAVRKQQRFFFRCFFFPPHFNLFVSDQRWTRFSLTALSIVGCCRLVAVTEEDLVVVPAVCFVR